MVAVQVLLMNYFLLGLHTDQQISNDVLLPEEPLLTGGECSYGCLQCSPINGCLACKHPYFLYLHRDGSRQTALCTRSCPGGFYKLKRKNKQGFCAKCMLRGCVECATRHFCSVCKRGLVRYAGRCRKRCPEGTKLGVRFPGLCLSAPETVPDKSSNEIEANGTIPSWKPTIGYPGTRKPHHHPERDPSPPSVPLYPSQEGKEVTRKTPSHPTTPKSPILQPPDDPSMTRLEDTYALYPELSTNTTNSTSPTTPGPRRRNKKKKRKKKRRKEKDKRRHERNRRRKARERRRRRRLRNKERRKKIDMEDVPSTVAPVIPIDN
ncbi:R-spondin-1-like [Macrobrachium rosenbergii]|uniref:R-spondin-1-like n=1 Tax=Macrobrachium rosenbergii TaxID=79674 RepID=UPI0034D5E6E1